MHTMEDIDTVEEELVALARYEVVTRCASMCDDPAVLLVLSIWLQAANTYAQ